MLEMESAGTHLMQRVCMLPKRKTQPENDLVRHSKGKVNLSSSLITQVVSCARSSVEISFWRVVPHSSRVLWNVWCLGGVNSTICH